MTDFVVRPMLPSDEPFVYRAWLEGYWTHFPGNLVMPKGEFMQRWHTLIERILRDARTVAVVAHVNGHPDMLLGFAVGSARCLHWAYVKQAFRGIGVATAMLGAIDGEYDDIPCRTISHWAGRIEGWQYAPELLKEYV